MSEMDKEYKILEENFDKECQVVFSSRQLEDLRVKYLGRKSALAQLFSKIPELTLQEKGVWGRQLNILKQKITTVLEEKSRAVKDEEETMDLTFPSYGKEMGSTHVLSAVSESICSILQRLGFVVVEGGEIEDEWHNFAALNIPLEHPSRDVFDTFYLNVKEKNRGKYLLRSHTSPSQIRVMRESKPPMAVISPGRVYRPDEVDATHSLCFIK